MRVLERIYVYPRKPYIELYKRQNHLQIAAIGTSSIEDTWFVALGQIIVTPRRGNETDVVVVANVLE
jgi:hypothetical protein